MNVGSFHSDDVEHYMEHNIENYFRGVVMIENNPFRFETFPIDYMEVHYG